MSDTYVSSGTVSGATVSSGSTMYVYNQGAEAVDTTVLNGGRQYVISGGLVSDTDVDAGGQLIAGADGDVYGGTIQSGGDAYVLSGGNSEDMNVQGLLLVSGVASLNTIASGGTEFVFGMDSAASVGAGGFLAVEGGGRSDNADVFGLMSVGPRSSAFFTDVQNGGVLVVGPGAFAAAARVMSGGVLIDATDPPGGYATDPGASVISRGAAIYDYDNSHVSSTSGFKAATVLSGQIEFVLSSGFFNFGTIEAGAAEIVYAGGTATYNSVFGELTAYSGATVSGNSISGGDIYVSGATLYSTEVNSGGGNYGFLELFSGATSNSTVGSGGVEAIYGGTAYSTEIGYNGEQDVIGSGAVAAGAAILSGGIEFAVSGGVVSDNTIGGGILNLVSGGIATSGIDFDGPAGLLLIDSTDVPTTTISGFGADDTIQFADLTYSQDDRITIGTPDEVTITAGGTVYNLVIEGAASDPLLLVVGADGTGLALLDTALPCFAAGTRILTPRGEVAVEDLAVGDTVITSTGDDAPIIWIGRRRIDLTRHPKPQKAQPIRIDAEAFGDGVPSRDLLLSPDHALFLGGVLIPAKELINNRNIQQLARRAVTYFHIELAEHAIIFAENCPVETYLETGNRSAFENGAGAITLHPDFAQTLREQQSCAPFTVSGPALAAAREATLRRYYEHRATRLNS